MWMVYFAIMAICILIPAGIMEVAAKNRENRELIGKRETQILKGFAILLVIVCHYMGNYGLGVTLFTPLGGIGVSIFLILAAYGLNESWKTNGSRGWWRKRIVAVFIPYAIVQLCFFWPTQTFSASTLFLDLLFIRTMHVHGWYLNYLAMWYVLFYVIMRFSILRKYKLWIILALSICMFFIFGELRAEQSLSFLCGLILSESKDLQKSGNSIMKKYINWKWGTLLLIIGMLALAAKQLPLVRQAPTLIFNAVQLVIKLFSALGLIAILMSLATKLHLRFFRYVGAISFELYLIHGYVLKQTTITILGAILFIVVTAAIAILLWIILQKLSKIERKILRIR